MGIITRMRKQTCVYWAFASSDSAGEDYDDFGQPQWSSPIEILCRWENVSEEFVDAKGTRQVSRSKVYVDRDVRVGELLMLGELVDVVDGDSIRASGNAIQLRFLTLLAGTVSVSTLIDGWRQCGDQATRWAVRLTIA